MKESQKTGILVYLLLTIINVVIFSVELNYGTVKDYCRHEIGVILEEVEDELKSEENLTDERVAEIKEKYGIISYGDYVIDSSAMVQECVRERALFDLEF